MKLNEFRHIIREEIVKILKESTDYSIDAKSALSPEDLKYIFEGEGVDLVMSKEFGKFPVQKVPWNFKRFLPKMRYALTDGKNYLHLWIKNNKVDGATVYSASRSDEVYSWAENMGMYKEE